MPLWRCLETFPAGGDTGAFLLKETASSLHSPPLSWGFQLEKPGHCSPGSIFIGTDHRRAPIIITVERPA